MERLSGRVALISGAASGIGKATAERLAREGAAVVVTDVDDEAGSMVTKELGRGGARAIFQHLDVISEPEWSDAVTVTLREFGQLDILVNNAGIGERSTIDDITLAEWDRTIAIVQTGVFLGMKCGAAALLASEHASVINISSIFGARGGFGASPAYHAAKGAVRILTKNAAMAWAQRGVRVNSIHPGFIDTPLLVSRTVAEFDQLMQIMRDATPMGRLGRAEEIAAGVAYLASDDASFITGSELYIDGGYTAR